MCFFPFGCIWDRFATARNLVHNAPDWCNKCKSSCHEVVSYFFTMNAHDPYNWTLKLMFCCVSFRLGAFGTVSLLHETCCKICQTGAINAKVHATKSSQNFSQWTLPIHTIGPKTHVLVRFFPFWVHLGPVRNFRETWCKTGQPGAIDAKVRATKLRQIFWNERS